MQVRDILCGVKEKAARGRNGWFRPKRITVSYHGNGRLYIYVVSKRKGQCAPVVIPLGLFDALELGDALVSIAKTASFRESEAATGEGDGLCNEGDLSGGPQEDLYHE
jgi:hypothetical protein